MISNAKKAVIHIAKAQTGMTDEEYLDLCGQHCQEAFRGGYGAMAGG